MVWIYDDPPLSKNDKQTYALLKRELGNSELAERTVKMVNLYVNLRKTPFKSAREIEQFAFFDKGQKRPIFNTHTSKLVFKGLAEKTGGSTYPATDFVVREILGMISGIIPSIVTTPVVEVYTAMVTVFSNIKGFVPFSDLVLVGFHTGAELGVATATDLATEAGGIAGSVAVAPLTGIAVLLAMSISFLEGDFGQMVAHFANWAPAVGPILSKSIQKTEHLAIELEKRPNLKQSIPVFNRYNPQSN
jgi:hypothetical protein